MEDLGAYCFKQRGELDEAIRHLREAVRRIPNDTEAHYALGVALDEAGRQTEARAEWETVLALYDQVPKESKEVHFEWAQAARDGLDRCP